MTEESNFTFYSEELRKIAKREFPDKEVKGYGMCRIGTRLMLEEIADIIDALERIGPVNKSWGTDKQFNDGWDECRELIEEIFEHGGREY